MRTTALILWAALIAGGCAPAQNLADPVQTAPPPVQPRSPSAAPQAPILIDLTLYQFLAPDRSISQSKDFWKRTGEPAVDAATLDLLDKNGLRAGIGSVDDWPHFKEVLEKAAAHGMSGHFVATAATDQEIPVTGELPEQWLFYWDRHGLSGSVYDQCRNLLALSFGPTPGQTGAVRLELCPIVRATRRHYSYTVLNGEESVDYTGDEHLYDLNLHVDLPPGRFLVVAPSAQSERTTSIGHQFMKQDGKSGRRELILIFVGYSGPARPVSQPGIAVP
jgi:hypothetical protein